MTGLFVFALFVGVMGWLTYLVMHTKQVVPFEATDPEDQAVVVEPHDTNNPYLQQVFAHETYGSAPRGIAGVLESLTPDPDEKILAVASVTYTDPTYPQPGYLIATTRQIRWVKVRPLRRNASFHYGSLGTVKLQGKGLMWLKTGVTVAGHTYLIRGISYGRQFKQLLFLIDDAIQWQQEHDAKQRHDSITGKKGKR